MKSPRQLVAHNFSQLRGQLLLVHCILAEQTNLNEIPQLRFWCDRRVLPTSGNANVGQYLNRNKRLQDELTSAPFETPDSIKRRSAFQPKVFDRT